MFSPFLLAMPMAVLASTCVAPVGGTPSSPDVVGSGDCTSNANKAHQNCPAGYAAHADPQYATPCPGEDWGYELQCVAAAGGPGSSHEEEGPAVEQLEQGLAELKQQGLPPGHHRYGSVLTELATGLCAAGQDASAGVVWGDAAAHYKLHRSLPPQQAGDEFQDCMVRAARAHLEHGDFAAAERAFAAAAAVLAAANEVAERGAAPDGDSAFTPAYEAEAEAVAERARVLALLGRHEEAEAQAVDALFLLAQGAVWWLRPTADAARADAAYSAATWTLEQLGGGVPAGPECVARLRAVVSHAVGVLGAGAAGPPGELVALHTEQRANLRQALRCVYVVRTAAGWPEAAAAAAALGPLLQLPWVSLEDAARHGHPEPAPAPGFVKLLGAHSSTPRSWGGASLVAVAATHTLFLLERQEAGDDGHDHRWVAWLLSLWRDGPEGLWQEPAMLPLSGRVAHSCADKKGTQSSVDPLCCAKAALASARGLPKPPSREATQPTATASIVAVGTPGIRMLITALRCSVESGDVSGAEAVLREFRGKWGVTWASPWQLPDTFLGGLVSSPVWRARRPKNAQPAPPAASTPAKVPGTAALLERHYATIKREFEAMLRLADDELSATAGMSLGDSTLINKSAANAPYNVSWRRFDLTVAGEWRPAACESMPETCHLLQAHLPVSGHIERSTISTLNERLRSTGAGGWLGGGGAPAPAVDTPGLENAQEWINRSTLPQGRGQLVPSSVAGPVPKGVVSILRIAPGGRLVPHAFDGGNWRLRLHLGLRVPTPAGCCQLRVGSETQTWEEGKVRARSRVPGWHGTAVCGCAKATARWSELLGSRCVCVFFAAHSGVNPIPAPHLSGVDGVLLRRVCLAPQVLIFDDSYVHTAACDSKCSGPRYVLHVDRFHPGVMDLVTPTPSMREAAAGRRDEL